MFPNYHRELGAFTFSNHPVQRFSIRKVSDSSPHNSIDESMRSFFSGPWDPQNRIRAAGSAFVILSVLGLIFDPFYRRVSKYEFEQFREKIENKIDTVNNHIDQKIDGLTNALLNTTQRDKIAAEAEMRELRRENDRLKLEISNISNSSNK